ncbi:MAG: signal recognition particle-docking protein FtsY [Caldilineales bacterium]|nr:signal recognition particle-docking protein FtsY [Caldilineales bacterium]
MRTQGLGFARGRRYNSPRTPRGLAPGGHLLFSPCCLEDVLVLSRFRRATVATEDQEKLDQSLEKTRRGVLGRIGALFQGNEIEDDLWEGLEEALIMGDVGVETSLKLVEATRTRVRTQGVKRVSDAYQILKEEMVRILRGDAPPFDLDNRHRLLNIGLIVGVNGSGKTTSIGKLAHYYRRQGRRVTIAAGDTFRAAAIDQLKIWGQRAGVSVIAHAPGADPGAVVYDAIRASQESRDADILLIDTAGRLHTNFNLMKEMEKIRNVAQRQVHKAPHEVLLVLDATTGQNAITQAQKFGASVSVSGVILTKLDSTAKGGVVLAIADQLGVPVRFVGTGEKITDLAEFDPWVFVDALLDANA